MTSQSSHSDPQNDTQQQPEQVQPTDQPLDDAHIRELLDEANTLKTEGNDHFRDQAWEQALGVYRSALGRLPKRKVKPETPPTSTDKDKGRDSGDSDEEDAEGGSSATAAAAAKSETPEVPEVELTELERECAKVRAALNSNIGACYVKLGDHKEVVASCTEALRDDPVYVKALQRRAASNEQIGSWSALSSAQEDYTKLLELLPPNSAQLSETRRALQSLKPRAEAAQKQETDEMMGKLKDLGNSLLGNFGLSTDNFKFVPNGQGGYSMNFTR